GGKVARVPVDEVIFLLDAEREGWLFQRHKCTLPRLCFLHPINGVTGAQTALPNVLGWGTDGTACEFMMSGGVAPWRGVWTVDPKQARGKCPRPDKGIIRSPFWPGAGQA